MRKLLALLLLISSSGCGLMEEFDLGFGGDDYAPMRPASPSCNNPPPVVAQTQEPELSPRR